MQANKWILTWIISNFFKSNKNGYKNFFLLAQGVEK